MIDEIVSFSSSVWMGARTIEEQRRILANHTGRSPNIHFSSNLIRKHFEILAQTHSRAEVVSSIRSCDYHLLIRSIVKDDEHVDVNLECGV